MRGGCALAWSDISFPTWALGELHRTLPDAAMTWGHRDWQEEQQRQQGEQLTPVQRFLQAEPSWLRRGQTTTLFSSLTEKEPVKGARGGIASMDSRSPRQRGVGRWETPQRGRARASMAGGQAWNRRGKLVASCSGVETQWERVKELSSELVGAMVRRSDVSGERKW